MSNISIQTATASDADQLTSTSIRAFHSDIHFGAESRKGPPGYNLIEHHLQMIEEATAFYKIVDGERIIGAFWFMQKKPRQGYLYRIFIDPDYQRLGLGKMAFNYLFANHPGINEWSLKTPVWNSRTPKFYREIGFILSAQCERFLYFSRIMT